MITGEYFEEMKRIQNSVDEYLNDGTNLEENYQNLLMIFDDLKILENKHKTKSTLYLISKISNNAHRHSNFLNKIETILNYFKNDIKSFFSNNEIFGIFHNNKRILLFLIKNNIIAVDEFFYYTISKWKYAEKLYPQYFFKEIKAFIESSKQKNEDNYLNYDEFLEGIPENFEEKREIGENDNIICEIIRKDMIDDFITYVNRQEISLETIIEPSIYETNDFLLKRKNNVTMIEYAAFFGSSQIFKYLYLNDAKMNQKIWLFAIHGDNPEIIHTIEDKFIKPSHKIKKDITTISCKEILQESIKCHHNNITLYILSNYINDEDLYDNIAQCYNENIYSYGFHYFNFLYFPNDVNNDIFFYACQYDHFLIVDNFIKKKSITISDQIINEIDSNHLYKIPKRTVFNEI